VAADLVETRRSAGEAAVYVPTASPKEFAAALDELLDDPARRARMREVGLARFADQLAWDHQATVYVATWSRLFGRRAPRPVEAPIEVEH